MFLKTTNQPPSDVWLGPAQRQALRDYWNRLGSPSEHLDDSLRGWDVAGLTVRVADRPEIRVGLSLPHDYLAFCATHQPQTQVLE